MYVYRAAGENLELAQAELEGFLESQDLDSSTDRKGRLLFSRAEPPTGQLKRLALVHEAGKLIERGRKLDPAVDFEGSFKVKAHLMDSEGDSKQIERELGERMDGEGREVDLESPDHVFRLYSFEDEDLLVEELQEIDRSLYEDRSNEKRPYSSPVSLDPVLARVLVNLSGVKPGKKLLDPFVGTGGILIEAGLCGVAVHGTDIDSEMVKGARKNLEEYGIIVHDLQEGDYRDAENLFEGSDAVVTDLPYGRSSRTEGDLEELLEVSRSMCDGKLVFSYNEPEFGSLEHDFEVYVHSSLTRYIYVQDLS